MENILTRAALESPWSAIALGFLGALIIALLCVAVQVLLYRLIYPYFPTCTRLSNAAAWAVVALLGIGGWTTLLWGAGYAPWGFIPVGLGVVLLIGGINLRLCWVADVS